jgi:hypothetical protein
MSKKPEREYREMMNAVAEAMSESKQQPLDPIAEIAKHFPAGQPVDTLELLLAIQVILQTVQTVGSMLDRALWGIFVLACVCVAQLLALALLR